MQHSKVDEGPSYSCWKVPRSDQATHADGLLHGEDPVPSDAGWYGITSDPSCFLAEPVEKARGISDFTFGIGKGLAVLPSDQPRQVFAVLDHEVVPLPKHVCSLPRGRLPERHKGTRSCCNGIVRVIGVHLWHGANDFTRGRVMDLKGLAALSINPGAIDVGLLFEEALVLQRWDLVSFPGAGAGEQSEVAGMANLASHHRRSPQCSEDRLHDE